MPATLVLNVFFAMFILFLLGCRSNKVSIATYSLTSTPLVDYEFTSLSSFEPFDTFAVKNKIVKELNNYKEFYAVKIFSIKDWTYIVFTKDSVQNIKL